MQRLKGGEREALEMGMEMMTRLSMGKQWDKGSPWNVLAMHYRSVSLCISGSSMARGTGSFGEEVMAPSEDPQPQTTNWDFAISVIFP